MAEMIPDRLPNGASAGERRVFSILQGLPDDVIVYYEPVIAGRHPDFIVIIPDVGLLIVEAKGWYPNQIVEADNNQITINPRGQPEICKHPIRQARDYQFRLMDTARKHSATQELLQRDGPHAGKFVFPFGHIAILNNCTREQLDEHGLSTVFPAGRVLARDELDPFGSGDTKARLKNCFDPWWPFGRLTDRQIIILRSIIHPQIVMSFPNQRDTAEQLPLKALDLRQERNALSVGDGHRIVYGVAGSGKTSILVARARLVASDPTKTVLLLCYNRALAEYFQSLFVHSPNVTCLNFHRWASQRNGIRFDRQTDDDVFGERLLQRLRQGGEAHQYDAVFIDEAQDFAKTWFLCAKLALKEIDDGDLLIVGDGTQSLYRRRKFTWREAGVNAQGRTINTRFDLDRNYRNTREIMKVAARFVVSEGDAKDPESGLQVIAPNPDIALRSGPAPEILSASTVDEEMRLAVRQILAWLRSGLKPSDIAVLYRVDTQNWVRSLATLISKQTAVYWTRDKNRQFNDPAGVCVTTMHSAKGLQWRAVLIMRSDMMPYVIESSTDRTEQERFERGLMYVAITRAEEFLAFTRSTSNGFASVLQQAVN